MGFESVLFGGRPCDLPRLCCEHVSVCVVARCFSRSLNVRGLVVKAIGRAIGLDVRLDLCEIAICEVGKVRSAGRVASTPKALKVLSESLLAADRVALEVTGSSQILRLLEPRVARVIVVSPDGTGIRQARAKTDRFDARTLAKLPGEVVAPLLRSSSGVKTGGSRSRQQRGVAIRRDRAHCDYASIVGGTAARRRIDPYLGASLVADRAGASASPVSAIQPSGECLS